MQRILDLCKAMVRMMVAWAEKRWWYQEGLNLAGARVLEAAAEEEVGGCGVGGGGG